MTRLSSLFIDLIVALVIWAVLVAALAVFGVPGIVEFAVALAGGVLGMLLYRRRRQATD